MVDITTDQYFPNVTLVVTNAAGNPASVDGVPVWASSDETVIAIASVAADGMSCIITTVAPGTARATVSADADMGAGTIPLTGVTEDIVVTMGTAAQATTMTLALGDPATKTPTPTPV